MFMLLIASPLPALSLSPPSFSLTHSLALTYSHTEEYTLALQTLTITLFSLFSFSAAFQPASPFSSPSSHKGQRDRRSTELLIEAHACRSLAAAVWITATLCHWPREDCLFHFG